MPLCPQITNTPDDITPWSGSITALTFTSSTATYTVTGHGRSVSDVVIISDTAPDGYNGTFTLTAVTANTFTVANTTNATVTTATGTAWQTPTTDYVATDNSVIPDTENSTFYAASAPTAFMSGDIWFDTSNNNKQYRWSGSAWVSVQDGTIAVAQSTANTALSNAATALSNAATAQSNATTALANASTAYSAAVASLQPSADTIVNSSKQITAIATNGITVYSGASSSSGARVVMNSTGIAGYNSGGSATFAIVASTGAASFAGSITGSTITGSTLNVGGNFIVDSSGYLTATGATITGAITATSGSFTGAVYASSGSFTGSITSTSGSIAGFTINSTTITNGSTMTLYNNGDFYTGGVVSAGGGLYSTAACSFGSTLSVTGVFTAVDAGTTTNANTPNAWLSTGGVLRRSTASSMRYKENIVNLVDVAELDPKKLLNLPVRAFTYKEGYLSQDDNRYGMIFSGFISEEVAEIYPIAADYENGQAESWNDRLILPGMLALIQDQEARITALETQ